MQIKEIKEQVSQNQIGKGKGVGNQPQGVGGINWCVCPKCGYGISHIRTGLGKSKNCLEIKCPKCGTPMVGTNIKPKNLKEGIMQILEASNKSWATVDKSKLPKSCFLWIEGDGSKKSQWHLPIYEGAGGIGSDGMYKSRGQLNLNGLRAASGAIAGARAGKPMSIPADVRARITALLKANKIGQFAESIEIQESGEKEIIFTSNLKEAVIDKDNKIIRNVVLLSRFSANKREYTSNCLNKSIPLFEGIKSFANHGKKGENSRDVRDLIGKYENIREENGKVKGDLNLLDNAGWVVSIAEKMPDIVGNSIHAQGKYYRKEGKEIIEELTKLHSVDLVTNPATTVSLFENKIKKEEKGMEYKDISLSELQVNRPDLYEAILTEGVTSRNEEVKTMTEERDGLKVKVDKFEVAEVLAGKGVLVDKLLKESKLPEEAKTEIFKESLMALQEKKEGDKTVSIEEQAKSLIEDRLGAIKGKAGVKNNGEKTLTEGKLTDDQVVSIIKKQ